MQIFIKSLTGKTITIECKKSDKISDIKKQVQTKEGIGISQQRFVFNGRDLEDNRYLYEYKVLKESTFHLMLRLRGNGDMVKNHIKSVYPEKANNISLDTPICITFDDNVASVNPATLFKVIILNSGIEIKGTTIFDQHTRTATFVPRSVLPQDEEIFITAFSNSLENQTQTMLYDYTWSFLTRKLDPIFVFIKTSDSTKYKITLDRKSGALYSELICRIAAKMKDTTENISSIFFEGSDVVIEDDSDVLQIKNGEVLEVVFKTILNKKAKIE